MKFVTCFLSLSFSETNRCNLRAAISARRDVVVVEWLGIHSSYFFYTYYSLGTGYMSESCSRDNISNSIYAAYISFIEFINSY